MVSVGMEVLAENLIGEDTVRHLLRSFYGTFHFIFYMLRHSQKLVFWQPNLSRNVEPPPAAAVVAVVVVVVCSSSITL